MYLYEKVQEGKTVYFVGREIELGGKLYKHELQMGITTASGYYLIGTFVVYRSTETPLYDEEALIACSEVVGSHFTPYASDQYVFYRYLGNYRIQRPTAHGGGYIIENIDNLEILGEGVEEV